jgi:hypothetical protein
MENKKLEYLHLLTSKEINLPRLEHDEDGSMQKEDTERVLAIQRILKGYINGDQTKKIKENIKNNFDALEELLSIYKMSISAITK